MTSESRPSGTPVPWWRRLLQQRPCVVCGDWTGPGDTFVRLGDGSDPAHGHCRMAATQVGDRLLLSIANARLAAPPAPTRCRCARRLLAAYVCVYCRREPDECHCVDLAELASPQAGESRG